MTTEISYVDGKRLHIECPSYGWFTCVAGDFNKRHEGTWLSTVFAFVPQRKTVPSYEEYFGDGTPVASYEQFN